MNKLFTLLLVVGLAMGLNAQSVKYGVFDNTVSIGNPKLKGNVSYDALNQIYTVTAAGQNIWGTNDEFQYLFRSIQGDFIATANVEFVGEGTDPHRKMGWTVRNSLEGNGPHLNATTHGDGLCALQYRTEEDGETLQMFADSMPDVIRLERKGNTFIMSVAKDGKPLSSISMEHTGMRNEVFIGLNLCSHNPDVMEQAIFSNVRILKPAWDDLVPYQTFLRSKMEIMDVNTGLRKILFESDHSIQAPNWTADGRYLVYNSNGFIYKYDFVTEEISTLNTGFATDNNNDHVLAFDGKTMAISHFSTDNNRRSTIYTLPLDGSDEPKQITANGMGHSWLHGFSPDGKTLVFNGHRIGTTSSELKYDIIAIDIETGKETHLTDNEVLDDGPEYSPDGKKVYFNSTLTGPMKLWRMNADGSNHEQITFGDSNDWFAHVSPDGENIAFISYDKDEVEPDQHPFYKHVYLKYMPVDLTSPPKVIAYLYGGQGTINTPSWSPDNKRIAFVSNGN